MKERASSFPETERTDPCAARRAGLSAWIDGERDLERGLAEHLDGCAACRSFVAFTRATSRRLGALHARAEDPAPPERVWPAIAERLGAAAEPRRPAAWVPRVAAALVGFASVTAVARGLAARAAPPPERARVAHAVRTLIHDRAPALDARQLREVHAYRALLSNRRSSSR